MSRLPKIGRRKRPDNPAIEFDLDARGSRFTMRPAMAIQLSPERMEGSEGQVDAAQSGIGAELGDSWLKADPDIGKVKVVNGSQGRGAAGWIPVLEWFGLSAAGGLVGLGASEAVRAGLKRIRAKIEEAKSKDHRVLVSRGLAAFLAMEYVFETTDETQILHVEVVQEPSVLGGRSPSEISYTGLEPWIVSLVNGSRKTRYVLVVTPDGEIEGCIVAPAGEFDYMFGLLPPAE